VELDAPVAVVLCFETGRAGFVVAVNTVAHWDIHVFHYLPTLFGATTMKNVSGMSR
jgi:hypothetical protein